MQTVASERFVLGRAAPRSVVDARMFVALAVVHGALLLIWPSRLLIAFGLWWNANTIAHNFIHRPFFRSRTANRIFSLYSSLVLGVPQAFWRARHLAHHAELAAESKFSAATIARADERQLVGEVAIIAGLWSVLIWISPLDFVAVYLPGYLAGLGFCFLQGHFEHARGTTSHYGRIYNTLFFNDGYHVEHHRRPGVPWHELPALARPNADAAPSRWPAVLRWLDWCSLNGLERLVLSSPRLQRVVVSAHERAFRRLLPRLPPIRRVLIVGGGLFPRTAIVLRTLLPDAAIEIVEANDAHLACARRLVDGRVRFIHATYDPSTSDHSADLVVIPLAYVGDRRRMYDAPPARAVLVHDWFWRRRGAGLVIS